MKELIGCLRAGGRLLLCQKCHADGEHTEDEQRSCWVDKPDDIAVTVVVRAREELPVMIPVDIVTLRWVRDSSFPLVYRLVDSMWIQTVRIGRTAGAYPHGRGELLHSTFLFSGDASDTYMVVREDDRRTFVRGNGEAIGDTMGVPPSTIRIEP